MSHRLEQPSSDAFCSHAFCAQRPPHVRFGKYRCRTLFQYWHTILPHDPSKSDIEPPKRCPAGRNCLAWLANRSLAWSILNLKEIFESFAIAELALTRAYANNNFKLAKSGLQNDLCRARKRDCEELFQRLDSLAATAESNIVCTLQANNDRGKPYQLKELATAFTKRLRTPVADSDDKTPDITPFLRKAVAALQRISGRPPDFEIPPWSLTSIEVDFDVKDTRLIGRGTFGRVVEGEWHSKIVAVKELSLPITDSMAMDSIRHEVQIWSRLSHPNILPFYGACLESTKPFIVSVFCSFGNALKYIRRNSHVSRIQLLHDVATGMVYLHDQGIIHADLKASNILISDTGEALIADFGLSQIQDQVSSSMHITRTSTDRVGGTVRWMAPELLMGKTINKPADIYSFALLAWEFYTNGAVPFKAIVNMAQFRNVVARGERPKRPYQMDDKTWALVGKCWRTDPSERPDFVEIRRVLVKLMGREDDNKKRSTLEDTSVPRSHATLSPLDVKDSCSRGESPFSPPKRKFSLSTGADPDSKPSFLKGLVNNKIIGFSKSTSSKDASVSPSSYHTEKAPPPSNELDFNSHVQRLLSPPPTSAEPNSSNTTPVEATLVFLYDHSLKSEGVSDILGEAGLVPAVVKRLLKPDCLERESYLLLGLLANLACHGIGRSVITAQREIMLALSLHLPPSNPPSVQENTTRCLYNLSTEDTNHNLLAQANSVVPSLGLLLSTTLSPIIAKNVLGCLTNLSLKDPGRSTILSTTVAIDGLLYALRLETDDITREQALLCIGNLSVDPDKGVTVLLAHSELIPRLSTCLIQRSNTPAIKAQTLRCLRNLVKSVASHTTILDHPGILSAVCDVVSLCVASNQQKYALHFLHRFTASYLGKEWLRGEKRVWVSLYWYVENGSSEDQLRASSCLKLVEDLM
ncbi:putative serine/threonine-protein kinase drkD [Termitomyces sp. T112]|nr:putative serine/threonine-protein kinase drkD [Termitomyces sp. T112]